jgi:sugar phosphate isomerase/epimerase
MDMSRVSTCTYALHEKDLDYTLDVIAAAGFKKIDLWGNMPHFSADSVEFSPDDIESIAAKYDLQIANIGSYPGRLFSSDNPAEVEVEFALMVRVIDLAERFRARSIRVMPGHLEDPSIIDTIVPWLQKSAAYAETKGIYLGMENHGGSIAGHPEWALELCEKVNSKHFGVLYEPCNLQHAGVDYKEAFATFRDWITHCHLKDGKMVDGSFQVCHLGEGVIDAQWVIDALNGVGYRGDFALEYECWDIEPVETGLEKWYKYAEQL